MSRPELLGVPCPTCGHVNHEREVAIGRGAPPWGRPCACVICEADYELVRNLVGAHFVVVTGIRCRVDVLPAESSTRSHRGN